MTSLIPLVCTQCGGQVDRNSMTCPYCKTQFVLGSTNVLRMKFDYPKYDGPDNDVAVRDYLSKWAKEDLFILCGTIQLDYEQVSGYDKGKQYFALQLVGYLRRRGHMGKLYAVIGQPKATRVEAPPPRIEVRVVEQTPPAIHVDVTFDQVIKWADRLSRGEIESLCWLTGIMDHEDYNGRGKTELWVALVHRAQATDKFEKLVASVLMERRDLLRR